MKVLVTTSGLGSRLGEQTQYTNKSLLAVGDQPVISRIIESYPVETEFVVTLGHYGALVRQFIETAYPDRAVRFVTVDPFDGAGSSLAYSILQAREHLQCPFIYNAGDTLWEGIEAESPSKNWLGGFPEGDSSLYASFDVLGNSVMKIHPKEGHSFDFAYVGLAGIHSYAVFWDLLANAVSASPEDASLNDLSAVTAMIEAGETFEVSSVARWYDTGNVAGLNEANQAFSGALPTLYKRDEAIFCIDNKVLKFFSDAAICEGRVKRAEFLSPHVPAIIHRTENWYSYKFVEGQPASAVISPKLFGDLLDWANSSFWADDKSKNYDREFSEAHYEFYFTKSLRRIELFLERSGLNDGPHIINDERVPSAEELLSRLRGLGVLTGTPGRMHGDFILDNVIATDSGFTAIDWRQGFASAELYGDVYYDIAKLNHSLTMDHRILNAGHYELDHGRRGFSVSVLRKSVLLECEEILRTFVVDKGFDFHQVEVLTPLIWINMAPLHSHSLGMFLFQYGRYKLWRAVEQLSNRSS